MTEVSVTRHEETYYEEESGVSGIWLVQTKPPRMTVGLGVCWFPGEYYSVPIVYKRPCK